MVAASKAKTQQPVVAETEPKIETTAVDDQIDNTADFPRVNLSSRQSHGGEESHGVPLGIRSGGEGKNPDAVPAIGQDQLDEEAAVGSIHHILKTAFKELYGGGSSNDETDDEVAEEGNGRQGTPANASDSGSRRPSSVAKESAANGGGADEGQLAMTSDGEAAFQDLERNTSPEGRKLEVAETVEDTAAIEEREEIEVLKKQGILIGAHIPMGPSGLILDRSTIGTFGGFAISLLDAAELARANRRAGLRHSGNLPWNEFSQKKPHGEGGDARFQPPGYLKHTTTNATREALTLKRSFGRHGEKGIRQQLQLEAQRDLERAMSGDTIVTGNDRLAADTTRLYGEALAGEEEGAATAAGVWKDRGVLEDDTTDDDSADDAAQRASSRSKVIVKGAQRDADAAVMTRMQRKLRFRRNPRYDPDSRWHEQFWGRNMHVFEGVLAVALTCTTSDARLKTRNKALTKTELLASIPPPGDIDGENGYFLASPAVVEYFDYWVGQTFRAEFVLRNISCLKRSFMLLPPSTKYFSLAKVIFPSSEIDPASGVVTGTGEIAPGVRATVLVDFVPDSLGEYHDVISVVTEIGTFEVPIFAHRRRPCLSLPPSGLLHCGGCLLGECRTLRFRVKNTGGPVRFRLLPRRPSEKTAAAADVHQHGESRGEATAAAVAADDGHHAGQHGGNGSELQGGAATRLDRSVLRTSAGCDETFGSLKIPPAATPEAISRANGGIHSDGNGGHDGGDDRKVDFDNSSFNPDGNNGRLEDGPFCVFPTDYCVGEGETVFINVEYLPSEVGVHEACFIMVQDNCDERDLRVEALCEQVSLRISSIDGTPVPALQSPSKASLPTSHCQDQQQLVLPTDKAADLGSAVVASPAAISHLLFEPTLLASTCQRQFTLRNDTTGDLRIRWETSDITSAQKRQQRGQKKNSATSRSSSSGDPPSASPTTSATRTGGGGGDIFGTVGDGEATERRGSAYVDRGGAQAGADWEPEANAPRNEKRTGDVPAGGIQPSSSLAARTTAQMPKGLATAAGRGPFVIFPGFAVVPARGEVSFEVAFSPPALGEVGLFLRSLDPDGKGSFSRDEFMKGLRAMCPLLEEAAATFVNSVTSKGNGEHVTNLIHEAVNKLDPHDDTDSDAEGPFVGVKEALAAMGAELQTRISHALGRKSLEELVEGHRKDMPGFQMELRGSGEPVRLSLRPAMLQAPGDHVPYGQPLAMDFEVCNGSSAPAQFEFDLPGMTVSLLGNDAFTTTSPGAEVDSSRNWCDLDICPVEGVVPAGESVKCRATITPYCVGSRVVSVPIVAPTAAPAELGEELRLRLGFVGSGGTARVEAAEAKWNFSISCFRVR
ncbi:conserved unknown protein [Ectocarpus siliculosus]|uniref:EF-hand domain-containing protein n=1 Tax=Ectocarpus siliculosus TaxID=2880 RepID=D7G9C2_ECTSI|nr:conserved unknown protein [Ectocarpus siliculosus]|eukprot:CBJ28265.1 conserved unknown protein [Ectocarpus siliculosus]